MQTAGSFRRARITTARMLAGAATSAALILTLGAAASPAASVRAGAGTITKDPFQLNAVSALSSSDAWAVGSGGNTLHWDGTSWSPVSLPGKDRAGYRLSAVDALSPSDIWAAGQRVAIPSQVTRTLIVHWDGTAWTRVPSPGPSNSNLIPSLYYLSMDSATDGWATGFVENRTTGAFTNLVLHWNGTSWQRVTIRPQFVFGGVASFSPTDATAVGSVLTGPSAEAGAVFHWDGTSWAQTAALHAPPGVSATTVEADGLSARSATDMWAIGYDARPGSSGNLAWHWNGTRWAVTTTPAGVLLGVAAISPADAWVVGTDLTPNGGSKTLTLHWDGTSWTRVPAPDPPARIPDPPAPIPDPPTNPPDNVLNGVSAVSASDVWAVGYHQDAIGNRYTLILHWDGTAWTRF